MLLDRRCPLVPQLYRQARVCEAEKVPFHRKIELMEALIREFEPVAGTTHGLRNESTDPTRKKENEHLDREAHFS